jgi:GNAT superfamily N-acetyltransferase
MMAVVAIPRESRGVLTPLFAAHRRDRVIIDCVLEGRIGQAFADDLAAPTVARLDCGPFAALAGNPASPAARDLIRHAPIDWVTPETDAWRAFLETEFAGRIRRIRFVELSSASLDAGRLEALSRALPKGYEITRLNAELAEALIRDLGKQWLLSSYASMDDFLARGIGYVVLCEDRVVAGAASAVSSSRAIDIDIEVAPAHRRKGLGAAIGAALALECLRRDIEPLWLASNGVSVHLAQKLGYIAGGTYETFEIQKTRAESQPPAS